MKILNRKISIRVSMAILVITILLVSVVIIFAVSSNFTVPNTFTSGTTISASEMNANFQAIGQQLPYSKTTSFGITTLTVGAEQNVSGILTVTPPMDGYLMLYVRDTVTTTTGNYIEVCLNSTNSSGSTVIDSYCHAAYTEVNHNFPYAQGAVTAGTPLYFYVGTKFVQTATTVSGSLSALFIPAPNQLP